MQMSNQSHPKEGKEVKDTIRFASYGMTNMLSKFAMVKKTFVQCRIDACSRSSSVDGKLDM